MDGLDTRERQVLCDTKWQIFAKRARLFRHIPFVTFALGAGSMAVGNVDEDSDFDVLVGVRSGQIFTARFCAALIFGLRGWRRAKEHGSSEARNKICLNHFVTPASYALRLAPNAYFEYLYAHLVPLYGEEAEIEQFFKANAGWMKQQNLWRGDLRHQASQPSMLKKFLEWLCGARIEKFLKQYQIARIEQGMNPQNVDRKTQNERHEMRISGEGKSEIIELPPMIVYSDDELEFHPDPLRISMSSMSA